MTTTTFSLSGLLGALLVFCAKALLYGTFLAIGFGIVTYWSQFLQYYLQAFLEGNMHGPGKTEFARANNLSFYQEMQEEWWCRPIKPYMKMYKAMEA